MRPDPTRSRPQRDAARRAPRPAPVVLARSFDAGEPVRARVGLRREYDLGAAPSLPRAAGVAALSAGEYDLARRDTPALPPPEVAAPAPTPAALRGQPASPRPAADAAAPPGAARTAAEQSFTQRQLKQLITDDALRSDLEQILRAKGGPGAAGPPAAPPARAPAHHAPAAAQSAPPPAPDPHGIFNEIAERMRYAKAYDLGSIDLERRFDEFERAGRPRALPVVRAQGSAATAAPAAPLPHAGERDWPPPPVNLAAYSLAEVKQAFNEFAYEPDPTPDEARQLRILGTWVADNLVDVAIPQLKGKPGPGGGVVKFHRKGRDALVKLWQEWEEAGLLDHVVSFEGAFNPRFVGGTTQPSNHAFGIAFDINAATNGRGKDPALVGQPGSVRELVEIANRNGFFWGGHFRTTPDGMHFELGKAV